MFLFVVAVALAVVVVAVVAVMAGMYVLSHHRRLLKKLLKRIPHLAHTRFKTAERICAAAIMRSNAQKAESKTIALPIPPAGLPLYKPNAEHWTSIHTGPQKGLQAHL